MRYLVYLTKNLINKKIYVGVHKQLDPTVFDGYLGSGKRIKYSIKKNSIEGFSRTTLFDCDTEQEAYELESMIVDDAFISRADTYNLVRGGVGASDFGDKIYALGIGVHALTSEQLSAQGKKTQSQNKLHGKMFYSREFQEVYGKLGGQRGGIRNKDAKWYNDGINRFVYTARMNDKLQFDEFMKNNPQFKFGRLSVEFKSRPNTQGRVSVTNGTTNKMLSKLEAEIFLVSNINFRYGRTNFKQRNK